MLGSDEGIKLGLSGCKVLGNTVGNVDLITRDILKVTTRRLRGAPVAACAVYYVIGAYVIRRVAVTSITDFARAGLTWSRLHIVVVGWMFGAVGCHVTIEGAELSCELDYIISLYS